MPNEDIPLPEAQSESWKLVEIRLSRLFGERLVNSVIAAARIPDDLTNRSVLINGRDNRVITASAARQLVSTLIEREPRDIITTNMSEEGRTAFCNAIFDLGLSIDLAHIDYADIPKEFIV